MPEPNPATPPVEPTPPAAPAAPLILGKYATQEDLTKGLGELVSSIGGEEAAYRALSAAQRQPAATPPGDFNPTLSPDKAVPHAGFETTVDSANLDIGDLDAQHVKSGTLTPEQYKSLGKKGLGAPIVDEMLRLRASQRAFTTQQRQTIGGILLQASGGQEQFDAMKTWATGGGFTPGEQATFNQLVDGDTSTPDSARMAIDMLSARFAQANGPQAPATSPIQGMPAPTGNTGAFANTGELQTAMLDERYMPTLSGGRANPKFDRAFHDRVNQQLLLTETI